MVLSPIWGWFYTHDHVWGWGGVRGVLLRVAAVPVLCVALQGRGGGMSWEIFVFQARGDIFPWRNVGALAVQCVREAV